MQNQIKGVEGGVGVGWGLQAGGTSSLLFGADAVSWPAEQTVLIGQILSQGYLGAGEPPFHLLGLL